VGENWDLAVQISRLDQVEWDELECVEHLEETSQGTRSRGNKSPHLRCMRYWVMPIRNMRGGNAWINHTAFIAIDARELHPIVLAFASRLIEWGLPRRFSSSLCMHPLQ
jgi:hypothetical protein